jgi:hypothetical protein
MPMPNEVADDADRCRQEGVPAVTRHVQVASEIGHAGELSSEYGTVKIRV